MKKYDHKDIGYLYVIKDVKPKSRWIKVGKTANPSVRLFAYNSSFPENRMYYSYVSEKIDNLTNAEKEVIELLQCRKYNNSKNEWFEASATGGRERMVRAVIKAIQDIEDKYFTLENKETLLD